jgi:hypothetical protein
MPEVGMAWVSLYEVRLRKFSTKFDQHTEKSEKRKKKQKNKKRKTYPSAAIVVPDFEVTLWNVAVDLSMQRVMNAVAAVKLASHRLAALDQRVQSIIEYRQAMTAELEWVTADEMLVFDGKIDEMMKYDIEIQTSKDLRTGSDDYMSDRSDQIQVDCGC